MGQILKKNAQYIFYLHIFIYLIDRERGGGGGGGGGAVHIFSIFNTHHRVPNEYMMTINVDTNTNNYMKLFM